MADTPIFDNEGNETIRQEDQVKLLLGLDPEDELSLEGELFPELSPARVMYGGDGTEQQGDPPRTFVLD